MKKLKRKVATRRDFVRIAAMIAPAIIISGTAAAFEPAEDFTSVGRVPRKKAVRKKVPARKKATRKKATRRP